MSNKSTNSEFSRRRVLRGTSTAGIVGTIGFSGIVSGHRSCDDLPVNSISATTDFDSGGGVAIDQEENYVELTKFDEGGYSFLGYMHFKLEDVKDTEVSFEITNLDNSRMPADYRLLYTSDLENGEWTRMTEEVGNGFSHMFESDDVYISGYRAYPYQQTVERVKRLEAAYPKFVKTEVIGQSYNGRDMHAVQITDPATNGKAKKDIVSITRQHPGEVGGSWHMDAAIDYVLETFQNPNTEFTKPFRFHFIPNANPDGMYDGLHRHTSQGYELNQQWATESPVEIENMKTYMRENTNDVYWGFDFHSTTNDDYAAVIHHEHAADEDDLDIIQNIASHSHSYPDKIWSSTSDDRLYGFFYDEFDAVMVLTESWLYREYSAAELAEEGTNFFKEVAPREKKTTNSIHSRLQAELSDRQFTTFDQLLDTQLHVQS